MNTLLGKKLLQSQVFLENGARIPVTSVLVTGNMIVGIKTQEKNGYSAIQIGFNKEFVREVKLPESSTPPEIGQQLKATEVFKPGDVVNVIGVSKGKGFAGVVKRHHFKGGPKTHGQSDRERAPGAIGSTTTPGRVYKGKRMAGKMGHEKVTIKNLQVVAVTDSEIFVKGLVPGHMNSFLVLKKVGEVKTFVPLYVDKIKEETKETDEPKETKVKEKKAEEAKANAA